MVIKQFVLFCAFLSLVDGDAVFGMCMEDFVFVKKERSEEIKSVFKTAHLL